MQKVYIAHSILISDARHRSEKLFCGVYIERPNAYKAIEMIMSSAPGVNYVPQVRVAEIMDSDDDFISMEALVDQWREEAEPKLIEFISHLDDS